MPEVNSLYSGVLGGGAIAGGMTYDAAAVRNIINDANTRLKGSALEAVVTWAACRGVNQFADAVYDESQIQVPESFNHDETRWPETLAESGRAPFNSPDHRATPGYPVAEVSYEGPYALAQHEGQAILDRNGTIIHWVAQNYTKAGAKSHYLSDPLKQMIPFLDGFVAAEINLALQKFAI